MLRTQFTDEMKTALKAGDKTRLATIRLIQAALKDRDIEARGAGREPLGDEDILSLLQKMMKSRAESIAIYDANNRPELAAAERAEVDVISSFLPRQMDDDAVARAVDEAVAEVGATSVKDMGKVVGALKAKYAGRMDFGRASARVKERLAKG